MKILEVNRFLKSFLSSLENRRPDYPEKVLKPFLDFIISLNQDLHFFIPILLELATLKTNNVMDKAAGLLKRRIERRYLRLCRLQDELNHLNLKNAMLSRETAGAARQLSPEDYIFSQIDFSRYREIGERDFGLFFPEGIKDFGDDFLKRQLGLDRSGILSLIERSYEKVHRNYRIKQESPLILSVMRTLETSLEDLPLFSAREIKLELRSLLCYFGGGFISSPEEIENIYMLYSLLVYNLDNIFITQQDGSKTKLFISPNGELSGTFMPDGKPWTRELIPVTAGIPA